MEASSSMDEGRIDTTDCLLTGKTAKSGIAFFRHWQADLFLLTIKHSLSMRAKSSERMLVGNLWSETRNHSPLVSFVVLDF